MKVPAGTVPAIIASLSLATAYAQVPDGEVGPGRSSLEALWGDWRGSGLWRTDYYHSSTTLDDATGFLGATVQLKVLPKFNETLDGKLELRATSAALGESGETRLQLLEGYASIHMPRADLHIGKQVIAWGRADGINPTDNVSPRDFTVMLPFEEDQRVGTPAMKLDLYLSSEYTLSVIAAPFFEPAEIPIPAALSVTGKRPAHTLSNAQGGIKLDKVSEGGDWALSYYRGFSLVPTMRAGEGAALELHHDRIDVIGVDFARNFGRFGVRGELAYVDTADDSGKDPAVRNSHLFWVLGVDRTFHEYLNVNLQFFERRGRGHEAPESIADPSLRSVARLNAILAGQPERVSRGVSLRASHQWLNETLEAEVFAAVNLTASNSFVRPLLSYAFDDRWKATIGANLYGGAPDTQFGSLKANGGAFVELRFGF